MDIVWNVAKALFRLSWAVIKFGLLVIQAASDVSDKAKKNRTSIYGSLEAHELYEKGDISLNEFLIATRPKQ